MIDHIEEESPFALVGSDVHAEPANAVESDHAPLAYEMLCQNLGQEISLDILRTFLSSIAELVTELQSAIRIQSHKEATNALRELESASTVVGASGILAQTKLVENNVHNADWQRAEGQMAELVKETRDVGEFINQLLSQALLGHFSR